MRDGEPTPDHSATDTDPGPVTDVERHLVAMMTPLELGRLANAAGEINCASGQFEPVHALALAPTPRVEVSLGLARPRAATATRVLGGRYRLGRQLGVGGYGTVYAAEDTITGERVAIKVLSPAASHDQELIIRFHREAIAACRVRHPHIVDVADFDVDEDDGHYIVMEHLDGRDLAQTLAETGPFSAVRALTIAAQCARGLAAAHRVGVLHRDLKPANVFVVRRKGGGEIVKVIDFGISKLTALAGDYTDVTSASKAVGTPSYMAPEQARGGRVDARADVYALGVMLFEMLVGQRPFTGRSPLEILGNHLTAPRIAPSQHRPELAGYQGLDALVLGAIAADREQRFSSMEAFAEALVACLTAIAPDAAKHATEPTGERTGRTLSALDDDEATSAVTRRAPQPRWRPFAAAATLAIVAVAATIASQSPDGAPSPPPRADVGATPVPRPPAPAPVPSVTPAVTMPSDPAPANREAHEVMITSSPRGATVYRGDVRLGITPLTISFETTDAAQTLTIDAPGYRSRRVVARADRGLVNVVLTGSRPPPRAVRPVPSTRGVGEW